MTEIDEVKEIIQRYFSIQDVRWTRRRAEFVCRTDISLLGDMFDDLRKELIPMGIVNIVLFIMAVLVAVGRF